jgi:hypothetical protein
LKRLAKLRERIRKIPGIPQVSEQPIEELLLEIDSDRDVVVINVTDPVSNTILVTRKTSSWSTFPTLMSFSFLKKMGNSNIPS